MAIAVVCILFEKKQNAHIDDFQTVFIVIKRIEYTYEFMTYELSDLIYSNPVLTPL